VRGLGSQRHQITCLKNMKTRCCIIEISVNPLRLLFDKTIIKGSLILKFSKKKRKKKLDPSIFKKIKKIGTRRYLISDFSQNPKLEFIEKNSLTTQMLDFGIDLIRPSFARKFEGA